MPLDRFRANGNHKPVLRLVLSYPSTNSGRTAVVDLPFDWLRHPAAIALPIKKRTVLQTIYRQALSLVRIFGCQFFIDFDTVTGHFSGNKIAIIE